MGLGIAKGADIAPPYPIGKAHLVAAMMTIERHRSQDSEYRRQEMEFKIKMALWGRTRGFALSHLRANTRVCPYRVWVAKNFDDC